MPDSTDPSETAPGEKRPSILAENAVERPILAYSNADLALILGTTRVTVMRAVRAGRITKNADGTFDVRQAEAEWRANTPRGGAPSAVRSGPARVTDRGIEQVEVPADATAAVTETLAAHGVLVDGLPTLRDAQTAHEILKARRAQLDVDRLRGKVVEREKAHDVLATFTRTLRDHLLGWVTADVAAMAAELGLADLGKLETVLLVRLRAQLEAIADVPPPEDLLPALA